MAEIDEILAKMDAIGGFKNCKNAAERARNAELMVRGIDLNKHSDPGNIPPLIDRLEEVAQQHPDERDLRLALTRARRFLVEGIAFSRPKPAMTVIRKMDAQVRQFPDDEALALERAEAAFALFLAHLIKGRAAGASECEVLMEPPSAALGMTPAWREMRVRPIVARLLDRLGRSGCLVDSGPAFPKGSLTDLPSELVEMPAWLAETFSASAHRSSARRQSGSTFEGDIDTAFGYLEDLGDLAGDDDPDPVVTEIVSDVAALMTIGLTGIDNAACRRAFAKLGSIRGVDGVPRRFRAWAATAVMEALESEEIDQAQEVYGRLTEAVKDNLARQGLADAMVVAGGKLISLTADRDPTRAQRVYDDLRPIADSPSISRASREQIFVQATNITLGYYSAGQYAAARKIFRDVEANWEKLPRDRDLREKLEEFGRSLAGAGRRRGPLGWLLGALFGR